MQLSFIWSLVLTICTPELMKLASAIELTISGCSASIPNSASYQPLEPRNGVHASLQQVHLITRHGDRTPLALIPRPHLESAVTWECDDIQLGTLTRQVTTIPTSNLYFPLVENMWKGSCDIGRLTTKGAEQHRLLGQALRSIYVDKLSFLSEVLESATLHVRSTDYERTKSSVQNLLSALFPADLRNSNDQIALHVYPERIENLVMRSDCSAQRNARKELEESVELKNEKSKISPVLQKLSFIFGDSRIGNYFDTIHARQCHGISLPSHQGVFINDSDVQSLKSLVDFKNKFLHQTGGDLALRFRSVAVSNLLNEIFSRLRQPTTSQKFFIYSGHDTTISLLLGALNAKDMSWPPYASNLLLEQWKIEDDFFVRVIYNGKVLETVDGWCDFNRCSWSSFEKYFEPTLNIDLATVCKA